MKKGRKWGDFGFNTHVFPHSYIILYHPHDPNPKRQHKTHQNLEKEHFYEALKSAHGGKWKWRMRRERGGYYTSEVSLNSKRSSTTRSFVLVFQGLTLSNGRLSWNGRKEWNESGWCCGLVLGQQSWVHNFSFSFYSHLITF